MKKGKKSKGVRAWGLKTKKGRIKPYADDEKGIALDDASKGDRVVRVVVREA